MTTADVIADVLLHKFCGFEVRAIPRGTDCTVLYECEETGMKARVDEDTARTVFMALREPQPVQEETITSSCWDPPPAEIRE